MTEDRPTQVDQRRRFAVFNRRTSVATRLATSALIVSIASLVIAAIVSTSGAGDSAAELLHERLATVRGEKAAELEGYLRFSQNQIAAIAASEMTTEALREFGDAYRELDQLSEEELATDAATMAGFYLDEFIPALEDVRGSPVDPLEFASRFSPAAIYLQARYIAENRADDTERRIVSDAGDGSRWTEVHERFHPAFRETGDRLGFADLYLIEPTTNTVVYSTNKEVDFATNLETGPHSASPLGRLADIVTTTRQPGVATFADYGFHPPLLDQPVLLVATPVFEGEVLVGVVAAQISRDDIAEILERNWREDRFGETGEVYLLGPDRRLRSDARTFTEDPAEYFARIDELGAVSANDRMRMESLGTTTLLQPVGGRAAQAVTSGAVGPVEGVSYQGREVLSAYQPLDIPDLGWAVVVEQEVVEVDAPVTDYRRQSTLAAVVFVVVLTFLIVAWANFFVNPVRAISATLLWIRDNRAVARIPVGGVREFRMLADGLNQMVADLARRRRRVTDALSRKLAVLQTVLPPAAAERVGIGDRHLLETIPQATVAVLVFEDLDQRVGQQSAAEHHDLLQRIIETADGLAEANGLERIKVMGDSYYAVCGIGTPYLDHAPRAMNFARQVQLALRAVDDDGQEVAAGLSSGSVTVGLVGDSRLIYDVWGETVDTATRLARAAHGGMILVSGTTRDRLPAGQAMRRSPTSATGVEAWVALAETEGVES
jgi:class 3 adenylate cyclase